MEPQTNASASNIPSSKKWKHTEETKLVFIFECSLNGKKNTITIDVNDPNRDKITQDIMDGVYGEVLSLGLRSA